jgi:hypothetical protein
MGITMTVNSTDATTITIEPEKFVDYLEGQIPPAQQRLLAESDG